MNMLRLIVTLILVCTGLPIFGERILRDNILKVEPGDFIVVSQNKSFTLLAFVAKEGPLLSIEEVSVPSNKVSSNINWGKWFLDGSKGNTCWIRYQLNVNSGQITNAFSLSQNCPITFSQENNLLAKLILLDFKKIPLAERKRAGPQPAQGIADRRPVWQPRLMMDGHQIDGVSFDGWRARWPHDSSDLSGKLVEVYLPSDQGYVSYFPYWLEVQGMLGSAKVRIVDSGKGLKR